MGILRGNETGRAPRYRDALVVLCILTLATAVYLKDVLFFGRRLLPADLLTYSEPWQSTLGEKPIHNVLLSDPIQAHYPRQAYFWGALRQGHFPVWNPYIFLGIPCDPMTVGVFADVGQLVTGFPSLFLPLDFSLGIVAALRLVLTGFFMYLLMRHFKASFGGALLAAIVFMFGANTIAWLEYPQHLAAQLWMPLVLLFFDRMLTLRRWSNALFAAVFLTLMLYSWYLQLTLYVLYFLFLFFLWHLWRAYRQGHGRRAMGTMLLLFAVAVGLALLMACVKVLVYYQVTSSSIRAVQNRAQALSTLTLGRPLPAHLASRLVTFFYPTFYGDGVEHIYWGPGNAVEAAQYLGLAPLFLIAIALSRRPRQRVTVFLTGLGICLLMARLKVPPFVNLAGLIPLVGLGAISRLATLVTFLLAIVAGLGLTALEEKGRFQIPAIGNAVGGTLAVGILVVGTAWWVNRKPVSNRPYTFDHFWFSCAVAAIVLLWIYAFLRGRVGRQFMALGIAALTFVDLVAFGGTFNTTVPPEMIYPRTEATDFLQRDPDPFRVLVLYDLDDPMKVAPSDTLQAYHIPEVGGRDPHLPQQYHEFFAQVMREPSVSPNGHLLPTEFKSAALWGMLNVKYVVSRQDLAADQLEGLHLVYANEVRIYRNLAWLPRLFSVPEVQVMTSKAELLRALRDPAFEPARKALVLRAPEWVPGKASNFAADQVNLVWTGTNEVKAQVHLSQPRLLVLSARHDPGWQVFVDGSRREVYRANGILMAVPVEAGEHSVRFAYAPKSQLWNSIVRAAMPLLMAGVYYTLTRHSKEKRDGLSKSWTTRWVFLALAGLAVVSLVPWLLQTPIPERSGPPPGQVIGTTFGDQVRLENAVLNQEKFASKGHIELTLYWRAVQSIKTSYTVFVHLVGPDGSIHTQRDTSPLDGGYPTNMWRPNELVADYHRLTLPENSPPGQYRLVVGLYDQATMERLPAFNLDGERWPGDGVSLEADLFKSEP